MANVGYVFAGIASLYIALCAFERKPIEVRGAKFRGGQKGILREIVMFDNTVFVNRDRNFNYKEHSPGERFDVLGYYNALWGNVVTNVSSPSGLLAQLD